MRLSRLSFFVACAMACSCSALIGTKDIFLDTDSGAAVGGGEAGLDAGNVPPSDAPDKGDAPPGTCGDVMTTPANCGKCGHSCLGGECIAGQCQPVALATGISPRDLAVDAKHVYWIEPSTARAMQVDKDGSNKIQLGGGTNNLLVGLGIDDANVYWASRDEIVLRCKIGGCANTPAVVTNDATYISGLAVDGTSVYWLEDPFAPARVRKTAKDATMGTGTTLTTDVSDAGGGTFGHAVVNGAFVYWTAEDGTIRRAPTGGGAFTIVGKGTGEANGLAVDDSNVYWSAGDTPGTINVAPKDGSSLGAPLAASQNLPIGVAVDRNSVYWVNGALGVSSSSGVIMTCSIAQCMPKPLATGQRTPVAITVDDTAIYWSNFDSGNNMGGIMKLAK